MHAPTLQVLDAGFRERPVVLRMPFRFGVISLTEAPLAVVSVRIRLEDGREGVGHAAEMLLPKWFDKSPELSGAENLAQLRTALRLYADLCLGAGAGLTAFGLHAELTPAQIAEGAARGMNPLVANYGPALIDRAILDALGQLQGLSFPALLRANLAGIDARLTPDLVGFDIAGALGTLQMRPTIAARHTVGMLDAITGADRTPESPDDGLPVTLGECIRTYGLRWFKVKLSGDAGFDLDRMRRVAAAIEAECGEDYRLTLDGNEQFEAPEPVAAFLAALAEDPALRAFHDRIAFVEQPIARAHALRADIGALDARTPVLLDESDADHEAFPVARALGYSGISIKSCKGAYRAVLNWMRCRAWNAALGRERYFISAEDLTIQPGISLQQDLALAGTLGCTHVERNGHHYVRGRSGLSPDACAAQLQRHAPLYVPVGDGYGLKVRDGQIALQSLDAPGLGGGGAEDDLDGTCAVTYGREPADNLDPAGAAASAPQRA